MDQSLSITLVIEGGYPRTYLSVQDNYNSPAQVFSVPLEFVDFGKLVSSTQQEGDYWIVTASPDNPAFQVESPLLVRHHHNKIIWDLVYEHYEPFLGIELEPEADDFDENIISFIFEPFQYVSTLYQACQTSLHLQPISFTDSEPSNSPLSTLSQYIPKLNILWQKYGTRNNMVENGQATHNTDHFALEAEKQWLQDIVDTLDDAHNENVMENLDAYLESLPEDALNRLEKNSGQLQQALTKRWTMLVNSLTEEEAEALEQGEINSRFPDSLKLRLMHEFIDGNPSVLLGSSLGKQTGEGNVVNLENWKSHR